MRKIAPLIVIAAMFIVGCASFQTNAGKTIASTAVTVDAAMKGWAAYVVAGGATADQENQVRAAYHKYQLAMAAAQTAYGQLAMTSDQSAWNQAAAVLLGTQQQLSALIQSFQTMPVTGETTGGK